MTDLENIAKQDITRFVADNIHGNTFTKKEKKIKK